MSIEDRKSLSEIGYQVIDAKNEHVEKGWIVRVPNDDKRVLIAASEGDAWGAARDHHASMTSEVTQADSGMDGQSVERAELVWANLPTNRPWASLPTYEKAQVCHTLARLTTQSGEGRSGAGEDDIRVPREPTDDMVQAGLYQVGVGGDEWAMVYQIWVDMFDRLTLDGGCTQSLPAALNARQSGEGEREGCR